MKSVLIIGPCFSPSSYPPSLRIRFFCNHLQRLGWKPIVLTVEPEYLEERPDWEYARLVPEVLEVVRTKAMPIKWTRKFGIGDLGIRSFWFMLREARRMCRDRKIDLLFIPGPPWHTFLVGPLIKKEFGIPYVLDYIDPWVMSLGEHDPPWTKAYWFRRMAIFLEPYAVRHADHIVAVSDGTNDSVRNRYPFLCSAMFTGIPYGGELTDFEYVRSHPRQNVDFDPSDGDFHFVYVGAMLPKAYDTLRAFFATVVQLKRKHPEMYRRLRCHFIGTTYAVDAGECLVKPVANEMGIGEVVSEHPQRVPYLDAVNLLCQANGILVLGTTETHYTASKVFPCIMADKPILAIFHRASSVVDIMKNTNAGELVTYDSAHSVESKIDEILAHLTSLLSHGYHKPVTNWLAFEKYTAASMTRQLVNVFDRITSNPDVFLK